MKSGLTKVHSESTSPSLDDLHREVMLSYFTPPSVLVDYQGEILNIQGQIGNYLKTDMQAANVVDQAHEELKSVLSYAVRKAIKQQQKVTVPSIITLENDLKEYINITVTPIKEYAGHPNLLNIVFQQVVLVKNHELNKIAILDAQEIEQELIGTQQQLENTVEALEAANEEEQSTNEELQSINEELVASQEELQSVNEELLGTNKRLEGKITELNHANDDIKNLLDSTNIITVFLDTQLCITRFTPLVKNILDLEESDIGQPIHRFKAKAKYDTLAEDARRVLENKKAVNQEIEAENGTFFWLEMHLYRTVQDEVGGVALTFTDITKKKQQEQEQEQELENYRNNLVQMVKEKTEALSAKEIQFLNIVNNIPGAVLRYQMDAKGKDSITFISKHSEKVWEIKSEDALNDHNLLWSKVVKEDLEEMGESVFRSAQELTLWDHQWRIETKSGKVKWLHGIGVPSRQEDGSTVWDTLILDNTEKKLNELALEDKTAVLERTEEIAKIGSWEWDVKQDKTYWSSEVYQIFGKGRAEGAPTLKDFHELVNPESFEKLKEGAQNALDNDTPFEIELTIHRREGNTCYCYGRGYPRKNDKGEITHLYGSFQDITDRKLTEISLQESKDNYKNIANNTPGLVLRYKINPDGSDKLLFLSQGVEDVYEISQADAVEDVSLMWKLIHPDDAGWYVESIQKSAEDLSPWNIEHRILMPDGRVKWINGRGIPKKLPDGSLVWDTIGLDITRRKELEEQQRTLKEQLDLAITTAQVGVWTLDIDTERLDWNDQLLDIYGISREDFENNLDSWQKLMHPDDQERANQDLERVFQGETVFGVYFRVVRPDGDIRHVSAAASPMTEDDKVVSLVGVNLDITEYKRSEAQLNQAKVAAEASEEEFRIKNEELRYAQRRLKSTSGQLDLAIKAAQMGMWARDLSTNKLEWNDELLEIYGLSRKELEADLNLLETLIHPDDQKYAVQELEKAYAGQPVSGVRFRVIRPSGEIRHVDAAANPVVEGGKVISLVGINLDITEYKRIESELTLAKELAESKERQVVQKNEELEKTNEELDRFVYSVSHDLRAPIASSIGLSDLSLTTNSLEEVHEYDRLRLKTMHKLDRFIQDILNYSRNSRVPIKPESINFEEVIDTILIEYHTEIVEGMAEIEKDMQSTGEFRGDRLRVNIVLNNLLSNAFKFRKPHEHLAINIKVKADSHSATLEISDNGIGIKKESQSQIFDMFYRASAQQEGSGIGLYILKECVDKMEGSIQLESEEGKGATFKIRIPSGAVQQ